VAAISPSRAVRASATVEEVVEASPPDLSASDGMISSRERVVPVHQTCLTLRSLLMRSTR
jgi:hypothetical protein